MQAEAGNVFAFSDIFCFGFGKNKLLEERNSHRRALLLPLHAIFLGGINHYA